LIKLVVSYAKAINHIKQLDIAQIMGMLKGMNHNLLPLSIDKAFLHFRK